MTEQHDITGNEEQNNNIIDINAINDLVKKLKDKKTELKTILKDKSCMTKQNINVLSYMLYVGINNIKVIEKDGIEYYNISLPEQLYDSGNLTKYTNFPSCYRNNIKNKIIHSFSNIDDIIKIDVKVNVVILKKIKNLVIEESKIIQSIDDNGVVTNIIKIEKNKKIKCFIDINDFKQSTEYKNSKLFNSKGIFNQNYKTLLNNNGYLEEDANNDYVVPNKKMSIIQLLSYLCENNTLPTYIKPNIIMEDTSLNDNSLLQFNVRFIDSFDLHNFPYMYEAKCTEEKCTEPLNKLDIFEHINTSKCKSIKEVVTKDNKVLKKKCNGKLKRESHIISKSLELYKAEGIIVDYDTLDDEKIKYDKQEKVSTFYCLTPIDKNLLNCCKVQCVRIGIKGFEDSYIVLSFYNDYEKLDYDVFDDNKPIVDLKRPITFVDNMIFSMNNFFKKNLDISMTNKGYYFTWLYGIQFMLKEVFNYNTFSIFLGISGCAKTTGYYSWRTFFQSAITCANTSSLDLSRGGLIRGTLKSGKSVEGLAQRRNNVLVDEINKQILEKTTTTTNNNGRDDNNVFAIIKQIGTTSSDVGTLNDNKHTNKIKSNIMCTGNIKGNDTIQIQYSMKFKNIIEEMCKNDVSAYDEYKKINTFKIDNYLHSINRLYHINPYLAKAHYHLRCSMTNCPKTFLEIEYIYRFSIALFCDDVVLNKEQQKNSFYSDTENVRELGYHSDNVLKKLERINNKYGGDVYNRFIDIFRPLKSDFYNNSFDIEDFSTMCINDSNEINNKKINQYKEKLLNLIHAHCDNNNISLIADKNFSFKDFRNFQNFIHTTSEIPLMLVMMNQCYQIQKESRQKIDINQPYLTENDKTLIDLFLKLNFSTLTRKEVDVEKELPDFKITEEMYNFLEFMDKEDNVEGGFIGL